MHCVEKKKNFGGGCEDRPILWSFFTIFPSKLSIYLQNYVKNGLNFKTTNQRIISFSMVFTNNNRGGTLSPPPYHN